MRAMFCNRHRTTPREYPLNPVLQVDKDEWETFLSEFSKLAKNYELILGKLDLALAQIEVQQQRAKQ